MTETCETCRFMATHSDDTGKKIGNLCVAHPPTVFNVVEREEVKAGGKFVYWNRISFFPPIDLKWTCGEHKPRQEDTR